MNHNEKLQMVRAMRRYGGSFVLALSDCFIKADAANLDRLIKAFPEIVAHYSEVAEHDLRQLNGVRDGTYLEAADTDATLKELDNMRDNLSDDEIGEFLDGEVE